ncbi:hypothetical protein J6590_107781, partial [Homalodisca vitripennis]
MKLSVTALLTRPRVKSVYTSKVANASLSDVTTASSRQRSKTGSNTDPEAAFVSRHAL